MKRNVASALATLTSTDALVTFVSRIGSEINPQGGATPGTASTRGPIAGMYAQPLPRGECRQADHRRQILSPRSSKTMNTSPMRWMIIAYIEPCDTENSSA